MRDAPELQNPPKHPPHSIDAEMSTLGGMMLDNGAGFEVVGMLVEADFYLHAHQLIFDAARHLLNQHRPCDFLTLTQHLEYIGKLEECGGVSYVGTLANDTPSAANVIAYAEIVKERSALRQLISLGQGIADMGFRPDGHTSLQLIDQAQKKVMELAMTGRSDGRLERIGSGLDAWSARLEDRRKNKRKGLSTGKAPLDHALGGGLEAGDLCIIAGRPGMGKTALALDIIAYMAGQYGPTAGFSLEMPSDQWLSRLVANYGSVNGNYFTMPEMFDDQDMEAIAEAMGRIQQLPFFVDDSTGMTITKMRRRCMKLRQQHGPLRGILVDYIQLLNGEGRGDNRSQEVDAISRGLKELGKDEGCPVFGLSQLNRKLEERDDKRPRPSDMRESGGLEQDADQIILLYRDEVYYPNSPHKGVAEIDLAKNRRGPTSRFEMAYRGAHCRFEPWTGKDAKGRIAQHHHEHPEDGGGLGRKKRNGKKETPEPEPTKPSDYAAAKNGERTLI